MTQERLLLVIRWTARLWSVGILLFVASRGIDALVIVVTVLFSSFSDPHSFMIFMMFVACIGLAIGLRWEFAGGLTVVLAIAIHLLLEMGMSGIFVISPAAALLLMPGALYLLGWRLERTMLEASRETA